MSELEGNFEGAVFFMSFIAVALTISFTAAVGILLRHTMRLRRLEALFIEEEASMCGRQHTAGEGAAWPRSPSEPHCAGQLVRAQKH